MRPFDSLTKQGRARRLRSVAWNALEPYRLDVTKLRLINNEANCTFRVDTAAGQSYALRINLPGMRTASEIRAELTWQEALWRDTAIPAPQPIRTDAGQLVVAAQGAGVPEARLCNLSSWIYGRTLSHSKTTTNFEKLGVLAAQLHQHGHSFVLPPGFDVPRLDSVIPAGRPDMLITGGRYRNFDAPMRRIVHEISLALDDELRRLYRPSAPPQLVHGDLHWWNVLVYRGRFQPIDFEDCALAFPIQDIAIIFFYVLWDGRFQAFLEAFRNGYEQVADWPEEYAGQLELLMGQRGLDLLNLLITSPYASDQALIPEFVDIINRVYRPHFDRWKTLRNVIDRETSCNPSPS